MAEDPRTYMPNTTQTNRARMQGNGVGQKEMDAQQDPDRDTSATEPQRRESFGQDPAGTGDDLGQGSSDMGAAAASRGPGDGAQMRNVAPPDDRADRDQPSGERRDGWGLGPDQGRDDVGIADAGDLGAGTPPGVDIHDLGQEDNPEQDWGDEGDEDMTHSSTNTRRGIKTEAERGQGAKTRQANKDIVSRRG